MANLAIIPVRTGSKRLPGKNLKNFFGQPLFTYAIDCAKKAGLFDEVMVSTESPEVAAIAADLGVKPPFLRPAELASDTAQLHEVCEHALDEYERRGTKFHRFCLLWATAPLRTVDDVTNAYAMLDDEAEAVVGVSDYDLPVFCAQKMDESNHLAPIFSDMLRLPVSQMPHAVCDNGSLCWVKVDAFRKHGTWLPPKLKGYWMPRHRSVDIDTPEDWEMTEYLYRKYVLGRADDEPTSGAG